VRQACQPYALEILLELNIIFLVRSLSSSPTYVRENRGIYLPIAHFIEHRSAKGLHEMDSLEWPFKLRDSLRQEYMMTMTPPSTY